jgi:arginyl-tRNA synthetase
MTSTLPELPKLPGTDPERCVLDTFRVAAAVHLSKALDIPVETAFTGVDLGKLKNDFTVAIPRFRLKGKPADLVAKVVNAVSSNTLWPRSLCD